MSQRQQEIAGKPPRLPFVEQVPDDIVALVTPPPGYENKQSEGPGIYHLMLHNPELVRRYHPICSFFISVGMLEPRDRELAIMRTGWLRQVPFIWGEHVKYGRRIGMSDAEIEAVTEGSAAAIWNDRDRAILRGAEEMVANGMVSDEVWESLASFLDSGQLVELVAAVGQYQALGLLQNVLRVPLWRDNPGLSSR